MVAVMTILADDPTAAAVLSAIPCYPVPPTGRSPAIEALRTARTGRGLAVGSDGVMLILRRPWLALDLPVTSPVAAYLPYGCIGASRADLRCGLIPGEQLGRVIDHFIATLPNEAAAFILWNEATAQFDVQFPAVDEATPSRLVYRPPSLPADWHLVCDIHSHGTGHVFFSATDDADDAHSTKVSIVIGRLGHPDGPVMASRLCADGMFVSLPSAPFSGARHAS